MRLAFSIVRVAMHPMTLGEAAIGVAESDGIQNTTVLRMISE
jgi:hypothetical protein